MWFTRSSCVVPRVVEALWHSAGFLCAHPPTCLTCDCAMPSRCVVWGAQQGLALYAMTGLGSIVRSLRCSQPRGGGAPAPVQAGAAGWPASVTRQSVTPVPDRTPSRSAHSCCLWPSTRAEPHWHTMRFINVCPKTQTHRPTFGALLQYCSGRQRVPEAAAGPTRTVAWLRAASGLAPSRRPRGTTRRRHICIITFNTPATRAGPHRPLLPRKGGQNLGKYIHLPKPYLS